MSQTKYRRKKILVDKKFQLGISLKIVLCLACYLVLFCLMAVFTPFLVLISGTASEEMIQAASTEVLVFVNNLLLPLTLTFTCLALHCILMSHKIAGPAYRINRTLQSVRDRDLSIDIRLRDGDYLTDIADCYNEMVASLRTDLTDLRSLAAGVLEEARAGQGADPEAALAGVAERAARLTGALDEFRLSREEADETSEAAAEAPAEPAVVPGVEA